MSVKLKLLPALVTLLAGAITSIITFYLNYEGKTALLILLVVLLLFYILGTIMQRIIRSFEEKNAKEKAVEEGKVVEKDTAKTKDENDAKKEEKASEQEASKQPVSQEEPVKQTIQEERDTNTTQESQN